MKKLISLVVIISLLITSQPSQANFLTDLFGGLFTIVSYPIQLIFGSTKSPFFVAQNPFVEKEWHKEERLAVGRNPQGFTSSTSIPQQPDTKASEGNPADNTSPSHTPERTPTPTPSPTLKDSTSKEWWLTEEGDIILNGLSNISGKSKEWWLTDGAIIREVIFYAGAGAVAVAVLAATAAIGVLVAGVGEAVAAGLTGTPVGATGAVLAAATVAVKKRLGKTGAGVLTATGATAGAILAAAKVAEGTLMGGAVAGAAGIGAVAGALVGVFLAVVVVAIETLVRARAAGD
jgi:hypothetical protein